MYRRHNAEPGCAAFVAHVQDPANYDIEIQMPAHLLRRYATAASSQFTYSFLPDSDFVSGHDPEKIEERSGTAYRCRLRGVGALEPHSRPAARALRSRIQRLLDSADNYVSVSVSDLDVHRRVLVDIHIGSVSLGPLVIASGCYQPYRFTAGTRTKSCSTDLSALLS